MLFHPSIEKPRQLLLKQQEGSKYPSTIEGIVDYSSNNGYTDIESQENYLEIFTEDESFAKELKKCSLIMILAIIQKPMALLK